MIYLFENPETGELRDVHFNIDDEKIYEEDGVVWQRRWTPPQIATDTKLDPYSQKQFIEKTRKSGTVGDLWDRSAEMSQIRADKDGKDFVKEKFDAEQAKIRGGKERKKKFKDLEITAKVK